MPNHSENDFRPARKRQTTRKMTFAQRGNAKPLGKRLSPGAEMPNHSENDFRLARKCQTTRKKLETHRISPMHELHIRYSAEEKETIVLSVKRSELSIVQALKRLGIPRRTFYNWYQKSATGGDECS